MSHNKTARRQSGFGIPEVVVAIVLLGLVVLALTGMFRGILFVQSAAQFRKSATLSAQREIETLRNSNYNDLTAGSTITFTSDLPPDLPGPKAGTVAVSEPTAGLKRVDVTVSYRHAGQTKLVKISSSIGIIGITK